MALYENGEPRLWSMGVRDGDRRYLKRGALAAVYYFAFRYFTQKGFTNVGLGLSRAFLNDGVLRYKAKWGQRLVGTVPDRIAFTVVDETPASASLLQSNPFIFERSGRLYGAVFLADLDPLPADRVEGMKKEYLHEGLAKLVLFLPRSGAPPPDLELPADVVLEPCPF
jgi:hypothetical protein